MSLSDLDPTQFSELAQRTRQQYDELKARNLNLDLTRGKPSSEQLDFSNALLTLPGEGDYTDNTGTDVRNYGGLTGIPDIRELWAEVLGIDPDNLIAGDSSSLNIMFDLSPGPTSGATTTRRAPGRTRKPSSGSAPCRATTATSPSPSTSASRWSRCP